MSRLTVLVLAAVFPLWAVAGLPSPGGESSWWSESPWEDTDRGFFWYPEPKTEQPVEPPATPPKPRSYRDMTSMEDLQKELKRLKDLAIMNPTEQHVLDFLEANNWVMDKSSTFADVSRRVVWANPSVDYNSRHTTVNSSLSRQRDYRKTDVRQNIVALARDHGIVFFYRSDCRYCHQMSPILALLRAQYGIEIMAISMDGGPIENFPNALPDNGISRVVTNGQGVQTVPAMFLVQKTTKAAVPLGTGVVSADDLIERIWIMTHTKPGQEF